MREFEVIAGQSSKVIDPGVNRKRMSSCLLIILLYVMVTAVCTMRIAITALLRLTLLRSFRQRWQQRTHCRVVRAVYTRDTCAVLRYFLLLRYTAVYRDVGDTGIVT